MSKSYHRQKAGREEIDKLWEAPKEVNIIHYSCDSFVDQPDGQSKRITSIAVKNLHTGQTKSFSIHKFGELKGLDPKLFEQNYDVLEKDMLEEYFLFVKNKPEFTWLHWNMRDENYGFHALELRYRILGGQPHIIPDDKKCDLSKTLIAIYGDDYIGHPRIDCLREKNNLSNKMFRVGETEAELFTKGHYVALHQSTLSKVDMFAVFCRLAYENKLETNTSWLKMNCSSWASIINLTKEHPVYSTVTMLGTVGPIILYLKQMITRF